MKEFDFVLKFDLQSNEENSDQYIYALYKAGCGDATIGLGQVGRIALSFTRKSDSVLNAVISAIDDVQSAIPSANLVEANPPLAGLSVMVF